MKNTLIFLVSLLFSVCFAQQQKPFAAGVDVFGGYSWVDYRVLSIISIGLFPPDAEVIGGNERLYGANLFATYKAHTLSGGFCSGLLYAKTGYQIQYRYCIKQFIQQRLSVSLGAGYQIRYHYSDNSNSLLSLSATQIQQAQAHAHIAYRLAKGIELTAQGIIGKGGLTQNEEDMRGVYLTKNSPLLQFNVGLKYALVQR